MFTFPILPYLLLPLYIFLYVCPSTCLHVIKVCMAALTLPVGPSRALWAAPAVAWATEAKTGRGWGVRGLWKFLENFWELSATPGSLLVHSWGPGVIGWGMGEWAAAGPWSHAWPVKLTLLHPAHTSFCLQYLQFLCMRLGFGFLLLTSQWWM